MKYTIVSDKRMSLIKKKIDSFNMMSAIHGAFKLNYTVNKANIETPKGYWINGYTLNVLDHVFWVSAGWYFIGYVKHSKDGNMFIGNQSTEAIPDEYDTSACNVCDGSVMKSSRYLICNEITGEVKTVCSGCLTYFYKFDSKRLVEYSSVINEIRRGNNDELIEKEVNSGNVSFPIDKFLSLSYSTIKSDKYISSTMKMADNRLLTTGEIVFSDLLENKSSESDNTDIVKEMCDKALNTVTRNDYLKKVKSVIKSGFVDRYSMNVAASIANSYIKTLERKTTDVSNTEFVGSVDDKIEINLKLISNNPFMGRFGSGNRYVFVSNEGNVFVWFSKNKDIEIGKMYKVNAVIKKHNLFNDIKQNLIKITYLKIMEAN